jgi:hypothetical protein
MMLLFIDSGATLKSIVSSGCHRHKGSKGSGWVFVGCYGSVANETSHRHILYRFIYKLINTPAG